MTDYVFFVDIFTPIEGKPNHYRITSFRIPADTPEEAHAKATQQVPTGHKIWSWYKDERILSDD